MGLEPWRPIGSGPSAESMQGRLERGLNTIEIEVATTLRNRLRVADPLIYGGAARQAYGLAGPVRLVPYGEARLRD